MTTSNSTFFKTVHVVGDSHALAFKGKSVLIEEYNVVAAASVCYARGLTGIDIINDRNLNAEIATYLLQQNLITQESKSIGLTNNNTIIAEQYATGKGFEIPVVLFLAGEIYVRKFLGSIYSQADLDFAAIKTKFLRVAQKYIGDIKALSGFNMMCIVHTLNPPTGNDKTFERINNFACSRELRGTIYRLFNEALREIAMQQGVNVVEASGLADEMGCLKEEYEFDGVHADPIYAAQSLKSTMSAWWANRGAEQSTRYQRWVKLLTRQTLPPIISQPVTNMGVYFTPEQVRALRDSLSEFKVAVCERPFPDWAHIPLKKGYRKYNEVVKYASVSQPGLKILHDVLLNGETGKALRAQLGAHFSLINCRAVQSLPHQNDGVGQQFYHRDGCPPGIFRGLVYLVDVDDETGPFEYRADPNSEQSTRVPGPAGSVLIFDANAVAHRAAPPRARERYAIDLVLLLHPEGCAPVAHSYPFCTWPVDPYLFEYAGASYPPTKSNRWFHPELVMPPKTSTAVKTLSAAEMAVGQPA